MKYKVKSLITAFDDCDVDMMGHQCNCFCKMGSGIAPVIANRWPEARAVDNKTMAMGIKKLGNWTCALVARTGGVSGTIINFYGQYYPGKTTVLDVGSIYDGLERYEALRHSLRAFNVSITSLPAGFTIGLPKMGAGIAGGDWEIISQIIEEEITNIDPIICVLSAEDVPANGEIV